MKDNLNKLVSVIIPTHKRPKMLVRAVTSVLNQTYKNIEIIIVDDSSNDSTSEVVKELQKSNKEVNIIYISNKVPMGACVARNRGIQISNGTFITGLDDDDEFLPNRIELLLENYDDNFSFICSNIYIQTTNRIYTVSSKKTITFHDLLWANIVGPQILIKKSRLLEVNGFNEELPSAQDYDLWLKLINKFGKAKKINFPLYILHTEHDLPRISTSLKKKKGYFIVYLKYKKFMTKKQKIYNLITLKQISNKKVSLIWVLKIFPSKYFFHYTYLYLIKRVPLIEKIKQTLK